MHKKLFAFLLLITPLLLIACTDNKSISWEEPYGIVGTESTQLWDFKADDFLSVINDKISDDSMKLSCLHENQSGSGSFLLTNNGETWKISLHCFSSLDAGSSWFKKYDDVDNWIDNIKRVELSLYSDSDISAQENGLYVRYLINIFTPGAEEDVENNIGLYGESAKGAQISEGINRVTVGTVVYTYMVNDNRFIVEPHIDSWPTQTTAPSAIRPK